MNTSNSLMLQGQVILNTRPVHQQAALQSLLESDSASVVSFPAITIRDIEPAEFHLELQSNIGLYDIALFVSRNAVNGAFRFLKSDALPAELRLGVIGEGSFMALADKVDLTRHRLIRSKPYNSEGLLMSPDLQQVRDKNILIFRGQQGRNLLGDELVRRGAKVTFCEVYTRQLPVYAENHFQQICANRVITLVIFTSNEGMINVMRLLDETSKQQLLVTPWILISERMRESAAKLGHNGEVVIASNASDEGIHQTIIDWASRA